MVDPAYTTAEIAAIIRKTPETVRDLIAEGAIHATRLRDRGRWGIPAAEVQRLAEGSDMARWDPVRKKWHTDFRYHHPDGERERVRLDSPVQTRRGAELYERQVRAEKAAGTWHKNQPVTVKEFAKDFDVWARNNLKPSTWISYSKILRNNLIPFFGARHLSEVNSESIERYKAKRASDGRESKTIWNELTCLGSLLRVAVEFGRLHVAPRIRRPKLQRPQDRPYKWLTHPEADKLLAAPSGYTHMIAFALHTGLRLGELQALTWGQIDRDNARVLVDRNFAGGKVGTPKGHISRVIDLNHPALAALSVAMSRRRIGCDLVFHTASGERVSQSDAAKGLWRACAKAGVERVGWHVLRHTFATWLSQASVPIPTVQVLLGHVDISTTMRYAHHAPLASARAVAVLEGR